LPGARLWGYHEPDEARLKQAHKVRQGEALMNAIPGSARQVQYVGFWKRLLAMIIDSFIMLVVILVVVLSIYGKSYVDAYFAGKTIVVDAILQIVLIIAAILFWRFRGATPGKMLVSAKIVDANTLQPASTGKLVGRFFAYLVSIIPVCLGFLWIAFDARKQGWHDKLAGTVVIQEDDL
jgi:uncharacterized RDD family membrane protein YckC